MTCTATSQVSVSVSVYLFARKKKYIYTDIQYITKMLFKDYREQGTTRINNINGVGHLFIIVFIHVNFPI